MLKTYCPVSLLRICAKTLSLKTSNSSILINLVSRKKKDFCINQLVSITHEICSDFDCNPSLKVRFVFLDAYQSKMSFNPDRSKQAQEVIFSRKTSIQTDPVLTFDNSPVVKTKHHKHLGLILDETLDFKEHLKENMFKYYKGIAVLRKISPQEILC